MLASPYLAIGQHDRAVEWCRAQLARTPGTHVNITAHLVMSLTIAGRDDDAMAAADGLPDTAEATCNPFALSLALMAYGFAWRKRTPTALGRRCTGGWRLPTTAATDSTNPT